MYSMLFCVRFTLPFKKNIKLHEAVVTLKTVGLTRWECIISLQAFTLLNINI